MRVESPRRTAGPRGTAAPGRGRGAAACRGRCRGTRACRAGPCTSVVGRAAGVGRVGVLVRPAAGAFERAAHRLLQSPGLAEQRDAAERPLQPRRPRRPARLPPVRDRSAGDDQVGEVACGYGVCAGIALVDRDAHAVQPGGVELPPGLRHLLRVGIDGVDVQLGALGQLVGQRAVAAAEIDAVALGDAALLDDLLGRRGSVGVLVRRRRCFGGCSMDRPACAAVARRSSRCVPLIGADVAAGRRRRPGRRRVPSTSADQTTFLRRQVDDRHAACRRRTTTGLPATTTAAPPGTPGIVQSFSSPLYLISSPLRSTFGLVGPADRRSASLPRRDGSGRRAARRPRRRRPGRAACPSRRRR